MTKKKKRGRVIARKFADRNNAVLTVTGGGGDYCQRVCEKCPWRIDQTGKFPARAFLLSANTVYDMSLHTFACHMRGAEHPTTCAGFLLRGSDDNLAVRMRRCNGEMLDTTTCVALHDSYKTMAVANGCDPADPALAACMPEARATEVRMTVTEAMVQARQIRLPK